MNALKNCVPCILMIVLFNLIIISGSYGEDLSSLDYSVVKVRGNLEKVGEVWTIGKKLRVESDVIKLHPGNFEIKGLFYPASRGKKPLLIALEMENFHKKDFELKKYKGNLKLEGKKSKIIQQHPISGQNPFFDYFDAFESSLGQMVVYFKGMKEREKYSSIPPLKPIRLTGKISPVFTYPKRPSKEKKEKYFFGFQMEVSDFEIINKN
ncbi:MAG: hypothetical protein K8T10_07895 [Candidatus Eremiobacteraeota bacterium]|nr:hypothetical protein [Candidatus Eremiobacteraeota bacterium]